MIALLVAAVLSAWAAEELHALGAEDVLDIVVYGEKDLSGSYRIGPEGVIAMPLIGGGAHHISATSSSARNSSNFNVNTRVVSVYATEPVYIKFGDSTVTAAATDHYFPAGVYYDFAIGGDRTGHYTRLAVLRVTGDGDVYISEKE